MAGGCQRLLDAPMRVTSSASIASSRVTPKASRAPAPTSSDTTWNSTRRPVTSTNRPLPKFASNELT